MVAYRRNYVAGGSYFFTVNLLDRKSKLLIEHIDNLRSAFRSVRRERPFTIDSIVILPDHLHCIWTLPSGDVDYAMRWREIKSRFTRCIPVGENRSQGRIRKRERGIWQRRYWEHTLRDELDVKNHMDYIHYNPVKHGYVKRAVDWPNSSFHKFVGYGVYALDWGDIGYVAGDGFGEGA